MPRPRPSPGWANVCRASGAWNRVHPAVYLGRLQVEPAPGALGNLWRADGTRLKQLQRSGMARPCRCENVQSSYLGNGRSLTYVRG